MLGVFYIVIGDGLLFFSYFVSVILHELAHDRMARLRGYRLGQIVLMPYGAVLKGGEDFPKVDSVLIAIFGPLINLLLALFIVATWWLVPDFYSYTEKLMWANLSLALFNLIPVFPLDGARVILALSNKKVRTLRILRIVGIILGVILFILMIISLFYTFNISLGILGIFLVHGAISGTEKEMYTHIMSMNNFVKSTVDVLQYLDIGISIHAELYRFLEAVREDRIVTFHILGDDMEELEVLKEEDVQELLMTHELSTKYEDIDRSFLPN